MRQTLLSININKYALVRNSRGHNAPNLFTTIDTCIEAGAKGITVHPRLDQRHIRFDDVPQIAEYLRQHHPQIEYNIECEPDPGLIQKVIALRPHQCTLVPVTPGELASDHGWDLPRQHNLIAPVISALKEAKIRVSLFADCEPQHMRYFSESGADRIELYTGPFAWAYGTDKQDYETQRVYDAAQAAHELGLGVNAGHDLDRHNLPLLRQLSCLQEVSIGHAHLCRALEVGTSQSVKELLDALISDDLSLTHHD